MLGWSYKTSLKRTFLAGWGRVCSPNHCEGIFRLDGCITNIAAPQILIKTSQLILHVHTFASFLSLKFLQLWFISDLDRVYLLLFYQRVSVCSHSWLQKIWSSFPAFFAFTVSILCSFSSFILIAWVKSLSCSVETLIHWTLKLLISSAIPRHTIHVRLNVALIRQ